MSVADIDTPQYFGTYCGDASVAHCYKEKTVVFGVTVRTRTVCRDIEIKDIELRINHLQDMRDGGLITSGSGGAKIEGDPISYMFTGDLNPRSGRLRGSMRASGLKRTRGSMSLSPDGLALTMRAYNKKITIRKDQCGNTPPQARITVFPSGPVRFGQTATFGAEATDAEDTDFAPKRLSWYLNGSEAFMTSASGLGAWSTTIPPGTHTITFRATDSGGLSDSTSRTLTVLNDQPDPPEIFKPADGATVPTGCDIAFSGRAYDREDGFLGGPHLRWSSSVDQALGTGGSMVSRLTSPGPHRIRLTARDSVGATSHATINIRAQETANGCPPQARIVKPPYYEWDAMIIVSGETIQFVGDASDDKDLPDALSMEWIATPVDPQGPPVLLGSGSMIESNQIVAIGNTVPEYEVKFVVTDSDGLKDEDRMTIYVLDRPVQ